ELSHSLSFFFCFFFQAEDGIRDRNVTGVQTCVFRSGEPDARRQAPAGAAVVDAPARGALTMRLALAVVVTTLLVGLSARGVAPRSEERRVGKEGRPRASPRREKKNKGTTCKAGGESM